MENEKISGKSTEPHNESDTPKVAKDIKQVELKRQSKLHEPSSNPLIHANETQLESVVELDLDTASESKVTDDSEIVLESEVSFDNATNLSDNNPVESVDTFYQDICQKAEKFVLQPDWAFVSNELASLALKISEGPEPDSEIAKQAIASFQILRDEFEDRKKTHYEE